MIQPNRIRHNQIPTNYYLQQPESKQFNTVSIAHVTSICKQIQNSIICSSTTNNIFKLINTLNNLTINTEEAQQNHNDYITLQEAHLVCWQIAFQQWHPSNLLPLSLNELQNFITNTLELAYDLSTDTNINIETFIKMDKMLQTQNLLIGDRLNNLNWIQQVDLRLKQWIDENPEERESRIAVGKYIITNLTNKNSKLIINKDILPQVTNISSLPTGLFIHASFIVDLNIWHTNITTFAPDFFNGLENLTTLSISKNKICELPTELLYPLTKLQKFYANENQIQELPQGFFTYSTNLDLIAINQNQINKIHQNTFCTLRNLKVLQLTDNNIQSLEADTFNGLNQLQELTLGTNKLTEIKSNDFTHLTHLTKLWIDTNLISIVESESFDNMQHLQELTFDQNKLREFPLFKLPQLTRLFIQLNQIEAFPENCFEFMPKLAKLFLGDNKIQEIPDGIFTPLAKLEELYLLKNKIQRITNDTFNGMNNIKILVLADNLICDIESGSFNLPALKQLNLSENQSLTFFDMAWAPTVRCLEIEQCGYITINPYFNSGLMHLFAMGTNINNLQELITHSLKLDNLFIDERYWLEYLNADDQDSQKLDEVMLILLGTQEHEANQFYHSKDKKLVLNKFEARFFNNLVKLPIINIAYFMKYFKIVQNWMNRYNIDRRLVIDVIIILLQNSDHSVCTDINLMKNLINQVIKETIIVFGKQTDLELNHQLLNQLNGAGIILSETEQNTLDKLIKCVTDGSFKQNVLRSVNIYLVNILMDTDLNSMHPLLLQPNNIESLRNIIITSSNFKKAHLIQWLIAGDVENHNTYTSLIERLMQINYDDLEYDYLKTTYGFLHALNSQQQESFKSIFKSDIKQWHSNYEIITTKNLREAIIKYDQTVYDISEVLANIYLFATLFVRTPQNIDDFITFLHLADSVTSNYDSLQQIRFLKNVCSKPDIFEENESSNLYCAVYNNGPINQQCFVILPSIAVLAPNTKCQEYDIKDYQLIVQTHETIQVSNLALSIFNIEVEFGTWLQSLKTKLTIRGKISTQIARTFEDIISRYFNIKFDNNPSMLELVKDITAHTLEICFSVHTASSSSVEARIKFAEFTKDNSLIQSDGLFFRIANKCQLIADIFNSNKTIGNAHNLLLTIENSFQHEHHIIIPLENSLQTMQEGQFATILERQRINQPHMLYLLMGVLYGFMSSNMGLGWHHNRQNNSNSMSRLLAVICLTKATLLANNWSDEQKIFVTNNIIYELLFTDKCSGLTITKLVDTSSLLIQYVNQLKEFINTKLIPDENNGNGLEVK